jgi:hypothetical protein
MLRAQGIDAVYYNPALISEAYTDVSLPIVNTGIFIANNSISLDTYNYVMKRDYLTDQDKEYLLSSMQPGWRLLPRCTPVSLGLRWAM